jgi:hypothetical protein
MELLQGIGKEYIQKYFDSKKETWTGHPSKLLAYGVFQFFLSAFLFLPSSALFGRGGNFMILPISYTFNCFCERVSLEGVSITLRNNCYQFWVGYVRKIT